MRWLLRKIDSLAGALVAALGALACAQLPEFVQQYLQRLGGHVEEARRQLAMLGGDDALRTLDAGSRQAFETVAQARLAMLEAQQQALQGAAPVLRPLEFLRSFDRDIAVSAFDVFVPALPLDTAGLVFGGAGLLAGWLLYELAKLPFWLGGRGIARLRRRPKTLRRTVRSAGMRRSEPVIGQPRPVRRVAAE